MIMPAWWPMANPKMGGGKSMACAYLYRACKPTLTEFAWEPHRPTTSTGRLTLGSIGIKSSSRMRRTAAARVVRSSTSRLPRKARTWTRSRSFFNDVAAQNMLAEYVGPQPRIQKNIDQARQRYTILTPITTWCHGNSIAPTKPSVKFKGTEKTMRRCRKTQQFRA